MRGMKTEDLLDLMAPFEKFEKYQTIEIDNEIVRPGAQKCWVTWENISGFNIDWSDKFVCDIGCYFGYFSTKVLRSRAKCVLGIDQNEDLLGVYKEVLLANGFENFETLTLKLGNGNIVPNNNYDISLAMNMLHHVRKVTTELEYIKVLNSIFVSTKAALLEVNNNQLNQIKNVASKNNFTLKNIAKSHRVGGTRTILYFVGNS